MKYYVTTVLIAIAGLASAQDYSYSTFDPPGSTNTSVTGMNNAGQIVGSYTDSRGTHNFLRSADGSTYTTIDLAGAVPGTTTIAAINNVGQITGMYRPTTGSNCCYIASADGIKVTSFDTPDSDSGPGAAVYGINDNGDVSGMSVAFGATLGRGFLRKVDGTFTSIVMAGEGINPGIRVQGVNNNGEIVGYYFSGGAIVPVSHGFVRDANGAITPFDLPGTGNGTIIMAINNHGQMAGTFPGGGSFASIADGSFPIIAVPGGKWTYATTIDDNGRVAGQYFDGARYHGFLAVPVAGSTQPVIRSSPPGVISALAFGGSTAIAPGTWIEIYGEHLSSTTRAWTIADFTGTTAPTSLDNVSVSVGGVPTYVSYISPGQVNAFVPSSVTSGPVAVVVSNGSQSSASFTVEVNAVQPSLLVLQLVSQGGRYLAALLPDFVTYVLPPWYTTSVPTRRAHPGETIVLFGMGLGPVSPAVASGRIAPQASPMQTPPTVSFNGTPGTVTFAGLVAGTVGLYQINVVVPNIDMPGGQPYDDSVSLTVQVKGVTLPLGGSALAPLMLSVAQQ